MKTLQEKIAIMQAAWDGKLIECQQLNYPLLNWDIINNPQFNWMQHDYRIKSESKKILMDFDHLPAIFWVKRPSLGWTSWRLCTQISSRGMTIGAGASNAHGTLGFQDLRIDDIWSADRKITNSFFVNEKL